MSNTGPPAAPVTVVQGRIVTPKAVIEQGRLVICGEDIVDVIGPSAPLPQRVDEFIDVGEQYVLPGFVDIHNHGLGGSDEVLEHWHHPRYSLSRLLHCGTLSVVASVIFSAQREAVTAATIRTIESCVSKAVTAAIGVPPRVVVTGSVIEGIHAEGPIIADNGGLPEVNTTLSLSAFRDLCATMPSLRIMTIAPACEQRVAFERLHHLCTIGVRAALGHDKTATDSAIVGALKVLSEAAAAELGGTRDHIPHLTHVFNVMSFHHREPGLVNYAMCRRLPKHAKYNDVTIGPPSTEIIGDLIHVHPVAVAALMSARNPLTDIALVSDCIAAYEPGRRLKYNGRQIAVQAEGGCYLTDSLGRSTKTLAGSTVTLADQLHTLISCFDVDIVTACHMLCTTPARVARIDHRVGSLESGKKANVLVVSSGLEEIRRRMVYGHWADDESLGPYRMLRPAAHI